MTGLSVSTFALVRSATRASALASATRERGQLACLAAETTVILIIITVVIVALPVALPASMIQ